MTAVEWLIEQLVVMDKQLDGRRKNEDATVMKMNPTKILEQAKEMEKQQIIDAYNEVSMNTAEQYYNKTFNKDNETEWSANYIQCDLCNHKWASVYPNELDRLECPNCSNMVMFETFNK